MKIYSKYQCIIPDYPREVKISESMRATYFEKGQELLKKYQDKNLFDYNSDGILINLSTKEKVVKNPNKAGKPRMLSINSQKIYVGVHHSVRVKIVDQLHTLFHDAFKVQFPSKIDLTNKKILAHCRFYDLYNSKLPDLDNLSNLFIKTALDCLTTNRNSKQSHPHKLGIIEDDKAKFIFSLAPEFTEVFKSDDRMLVFNLYVVSEDFNLESTLDNLMIKELDNVT